MMSGDRERGSAWARMTRSLRRTWERLGRRKLLLVLVMGGLLVVVPPALFLLWSWRLAAGVDLGRVQEATVLYSAPRVLTPGVSVEAADLAGSLRRLNYREVTSAPRSPGQFRRSENGWDLYLRAREDPGGSRPPR